MKTNCNWTGIVESVAAASRTTGVTAKTLRAWRAEGREVAGFMADGRIDLGKLSIWVNARTEKRKGTNDTAQRIKLQQERRLKIRNDKDEGKLIDRAWMAERIQRASANISAARLKSEAEHPTKFAAAANDVAGCRMVLDKVLWGFFETFRDSFMPECKALGDARDAAVDSILNPPNENKKTRTNPRANPSPKGGKRLRRGPAKS